MSSDATDFQSDTALDQGYGSRHCDGGASRCWISPQSRILVFSNRPVSRRAPSDSRSAAVGSDRSIGYSAQRLSLSTAPRFRRHHPANRNRVRPGSLTPGAHSSYPAVVPRTPRSPSPSRSCRAALGASAIKIITPELPLPHRQQRQGFVVAERRVGERFPAPRRQIQAPVLRRATGASTVKRPSAPVAADSSCTGAPAAAAHSVTVARSTGVPR